MTPAVEAFDRQRAERRAAARAASPGTGRTLAMAGLVWLSGSTLAAATDHTDLRYGPDRLHTLDLQVPDGAGPAPVVVYFHGGAFVGGDKHPCAPKLAALLAAEHIAFACADYRLAPAVHYPAPMQDGARAVQWLRAHAANYGLDPARVGLMGLSAGAGIAMWVAFRPDLADPSSSDPVARQSTAVSAVVTGNAQATYDPAEIDARLHTRRFPKWLADLYGVGSVAALDGATVHDAAVEASPIANMHAGEPPLLAWYAKPRETLPPGSTPADYVHSPVQGELLAEVARKRGASMALRTGADTGGWRGFLDETVAFFAAHLRR